MLFCSLVAPVFGQQRKQLEEKRKQLIKEIELTSNLLSETKKSKESTFSRYVTLQKQIKKRQQLIETLQIEIQFAAEGIERAALVIDALKDDVERLSAEYAQLARVAFRQRINRTALLFIFSAADFNDAFRRWQYIRQYDRYRKKQARLIAETQLMLADKINWLETRKVDKEQLLLSEQQQAELLGKELAAKDQLLKTLKNDESRLSSELKDKQKAHRQLNDAIEKIIREEMEKTRRESRPTASADDAVHALPDAADPLSTEFESNKGKLYWPVTSGVVTGYFGKQEHPTLKGVEITNNGIDIQTDVNAEVKAVFAGEVVGMQYIPGYNYMVILRHGHFYTVYSNLEEVLVKRGQQVGARQGLGKVSIDRRTNTAEVHFEIWREKTRLNPLQWVRRK